MSHNVNNIFSKYNKIFLNRKEDIKEVMKTYFSTFIESHIIEDVKRIDATERLKTSGFYPDLTAWRNSYKEIIISSCEIEKTIKKRYDYTFKFKGEAFDQKKVEDDAEKSRVRKGFKEFTPEEKEEYRKQKEQEKEEIDNVFQTFVEQKTLKDIIIDIEKFQSIPNLQLSKDLKENEYEIEIKDEDSEDKPTPEQIHGYSIRNYLMVLSQAKKREEDKFVGIINSFWNWKKQSVNVLKNPDKSKPYSYKILVPVEKNGVLKGFKLGSVFDISQTNKYEDYLIQINEQKSKEIWNDEIDYNTAIEFLKTNFPDINLNEDFTNSDLKSSYDPESKIITINQENAHTVFHELGKHITLTDLEINVEIEENPIREEILSEITCYLLMKKIEEAKEYKINYNFGYSNCWALNILDEFKFREFEDIYLKISEYVKKLQ